MINTIRTTNITGGAKSSFVTMQTSQQAYTRSLHQYFCFWPGFFQQNTQGIDLMLMYTVEVISGKTSYPWTKKKQYSLGKVEVCSTLQNHTPQTAK